jgi:hypothetical protein
MATHIETHTENHPMKPFGPTYKTLAGARKRMAFEIAMNPGEYRRGDVARLYAYSVIQIAPEANRVARESKKAGA